jgi:hypothetical protein
MTVKHWQDPVNLALGAWLAASPWALGHQAEAVPTWNAVILGVLIAAAAIWALFRVMAWQEWANVVFGLWLIASPWLLAFTATAMAMYNALAVGLIVAALALWALGTDRDIGGWWSPAH